MTQTRVAAPMSRRPNAGCGCSSDAAALGDHGRARTSREGDPRAAREQSGTGTWVLQEATRTIACVRMHSAQPDTSKAASRQTNEREKTRAIGSAGDSQEREKARAIGSAGDSGTRSVLPGTPRRSPPTPPSPEARPGCWRQPDGRTCRGRWRDGENRGQKGEMDVNKDGRPGAAARDSRGARAERTSATAGDASTQSRDGD